MHWSFQELSFATVCLFQTQTQQLEYGSCNHPSITTWTTWLTFCVVQKKVDRVLETVLVPHGTVAVSKIEIDKQLGERTTAFWKE